MAAVEVRAMSFSVATHATLSPKDMREMGVMQYASTAALALLIYDAVVTMDDEVNYIWCSNNARPIRYLFLFCRYFGLMLQIANQVLTFLIHSKLSVDDFVCRGWYVGRIIASQLLLTAVALISMHRVYILHGRKRLIGFFLLCVIFTELGLIAARVQSSWRNVEFDVGCLLKYQPQTKVSVGLGAFLSHIVMVALTISKNISDVPRLLQRHRIVYIITRDSIWVFTVIGASAVITSILYCTTLRTNFLNMFTAVIFSFFVSIISIIGCRLIINVSCISEEDESMVLFTSIAPGELGSLEGHTRQSENG